MKNFQGAAKSWHPVVQGWYFLPRATPWLRACITPKNSLPLRLEVLCTVIKSFQNRIKHALLIYFSFLGAGDSVVARKAPIIAYSLVFTGAARSTMHCMQTF